MKEEIFAGMHTIIILLAWLSPFWLDWKIIIACLILYFLQIFIFKSCILTNIQFKGKITKRSDMTMYAFWAEKMGFKPDRKKLKFSSSYIMPTLILMATIIWQILLKMGVLIGI